MSAEDPAAVSPSRRFRWFTRAWAVAALFHLTLPDVRHVEWLAPNLLLGIPAVALLWRPRVPPDGWAWLLWGSALVGLLWPLALLGDQLTQSVHLVGMVLAVLLCARGARDGAHALAVRLGTVGVYALAAFHKLNHDFLDAGVSCATGGVKLLGENWGWVFSPSPLDAVWPHLFLGAEITVALLFRFFPRGAIPLALSMHVVLTIVFAPAFAWVMVAGYPCFFDDEGLAALERRLRDRWRWVAGIGGALALVDAALYFRTHWISYPAWQLGEAGVWLLCVAAWAGLGPGSGARVSGWREPTDGRWRAYALLALFIINGATPYLGLQFHHAAAMLSNLRIDRGCWNHLLVPEAARIRDPYVRLDEVTPGARARGRRELRDHLRDRLWAPADLHDAIEEACAHGAAPLRLGGTYLGRAFETADGCAELPLPESGRGRFQTNLQRECPQRCIH